MRDNIALIIVFIIMLLGMLASLFLFPGCQAIQPNIPLPETPFQVLAKAIESTNWLATFSIIGIGAGFFLFLNGKGMGWKLMASCFIVLSTVLMIARFGTWIAFLSMVGAVGLMAYVMYIKSRAIREIVIGVQEYRNDPTVEYIDTQLHFNQSQSTEKIVKQVKKKIAKEKNEKDKLV